jgi:hypothetical protein
MMGSTLGRSIIDRSGSIERSGVAVGRAEAKTPSFASSKIERTLAGCIKDDDDTVGISASFLVLEGTDLSIKESGKIPARLGTTSSKADDSKTPVIDMNRPT